MQELVIISGKGGTGKTSLTAAFAALAQEKVLCDADVDAADLHLLLQPQIRQTHAFESGNRPVIDPKRCTQCGTCKDMCRFGAISDAIIIDPIACEGCGVCYHFCPEDAIDFVPNTCGQWFISDTRSGPLVHARLGIAEENSGKLVSLVRREARALAEERGLNLIITDGPPGIGCPVIASIGGASALLVVSEPTVSGRHDLMRVLELANHFKVPAMVLINKSDINLEIADAIEACALKLNARIIGRLPFDPVITHAMVNGQNVIEYAGDSPLSQRLGAVWQEILMALAST